MRDAGGRSAAGRVAAAAWTAMVSPLLDVLYPRPCAGCGAPVREPSAHLCWDCLASVAWVAAPFCERCGDPVDGMVEQAFTCSGCVDRRPAFERARSVARFRGPLRTALHAFKYGLSTCLAADFARLLAACVATHYPDVPFDAVTFVPLHAKRERERTYNQSRLLAARLARALELPPPLHALSRARPTPSQTGLNGRERRANVRGAFVAARPAWIQGRTLLLVDDVMTTGATVDECARVLGEAGAARVYAVTVGRG